MHNDMDDTMTSAILYLGEVTQLLGNTEPPVTGSNPFTTSDLQTVREAITRTFFYDLIIKIQEETGQASIWLLKSV